MSQPNEGAPKTWLVTFVRRTRDVFYFTYSDRGRFINGGWQAVERPIAVTTTEARLSRLADFGCADGTPLLERARYLAAAKAEVRV